MSLTLIEPDNTTTMADPARHRSILATMAMLSLVAGTALAFGWPTLHGEFLGGDDQRFVVEQVYVNHPSLRHAAKLLTMIHGDLYQPLPMLTFQADYALAEIVPTARFGVSPLMFHLTNVFLHAVNAVLACAVVYRLACSRRVALLAGLMFACHPLAVEPVAWICGRMILLATMFSLLFILFCLSRRPDARGVWALLGGISWLLALASKVLPSVPIAAAVCDYYRQGRLPRRCWITYAALLVLTAAATWLAVYATSGFGMIESTSVESTTSAPVRILLAGRSYLESYVWPSRLAAWSPPPDNLSFWSADVGIALAEYAAFAALIVMAWQRNRLAFVGLILFLLLLAPFLGATTARRLLAADRYMYLPMLGLHVALAAAAVQLAEFLTRRMRRYAATGVVFVPAAAILAAWMTLAWRYAPCWADSVARDRRLIEVYPDRVEARVELAKAHIFHREPDAALAVIAEARQRWPDDARLASEAGEAYRQKQDWSTALRELAYAVEHLPLRSRTRYHYALTLDQLGQSVEARTNYQRILEQDPGFLPATTALARSDRAAGDIDNAVRMFEYAVRLNPYHRDALFELASLHLHRQEWNRAETRLRSILELDPRDTAALLNLGVVLTHQGRTEEAIATYDRLLAVDPTATPARINKAGVLISLGRAQEAESEYRAVLAEHREDLAAAVGLHELLQRQQRYDELVDLWSRGVEIADPPDTTKAWLVWAHVLAGKNELAGDVAADVSDDSGLRPFVDWALAYEAFRRGDDVEFRRRLGPPRPVGEVSAAQREQARTILSALAELPADRRESVSGLYALARAFLFEGNLAAARTVTDRLFSLADKNALDAEIRGLADILKDDDSRR